MSLERGISDERGVRDSDTLAGNSTEDLVVRGTRVPADRIVGQLASDPDVGHLLAEYPELTVEDVKAALAYAHAVLLRHAEVDALNVSPQEFFQEAVTHPDIREILHQLAQ